MIIKKEIQIEKNMLRKMTPLLVQTVQKSTLKCIYFIATFKQRHQSAYQDYLNKEKAKMMGQLHEKHLNEGKPIDELPIELDMEGTRRLQELKKVYLHQKLKTVLKTTHKVVTGVKMIQNYKNVGLVKTLGKFLFLL